MAGDNEIKSSNYGESDNRGSSGETKDDRSRPGPGGDGGHLDQFVAGTGEHYLVKRSDNTWRKYETYFIYLNLYCGKDLQIYNYTNCCLF